MDYSSLTLLPMLTNAIKYRRGKKRGSDVRNTFIRSKDYLQRIELDEIYFFTKEKYKVVGIMKNNKIELSTSLYNINQLISDNISFFRCHKSYYYKYK